MTSNKQFEELMESVNSGIIVIQEEIIVYANSYIAKRFGASKTELIGKHHLDFVHPDVHKDVNSQFNSLLYSKKPLKGFVTKIINAKGETRIVDINSAPTLFNNTPARIFSIKDITEKEKIKEELTRSEKQFRSVLENVALVGLMLDEEANIIFANDYLLNITGYQRDEVIGKNWFDIFINIEGTREEVIEVFKKTVKEKNLVTKYENPIITKNGRKRLIRWSNTSDISKDGRIIATSIGEDITDQKEQEKKLKESEEKYKALFENANDAIFIMKDEMFIDCNRKTCEMFGVKREEILNHPPYKFSPEFQPDGRESKEKAHEKINSAYRGNPHFFEWKHMKLNGDLFDAEVGLNTIVLKNEKYLQAIVRNITEKKEQERNIVRKNKDLDFLYSTSQILSKTSDPVTFGEKLIESIEKVFKYENIAVIIVDEVSQNLIPLVISAHGKGKNFLEKDKQYILSKQLKVGEGIVGWVIKNGKSVCLGNIHKDKRYYAMRPNIKSELCVPLIAGRKVIGALNVESKISDAYNENDVQLLNSLAGSAAILLENLKLLEKVKEYSITLEEKVKKRTRELELKNVELDNSLKVFVGRELTIKRLHNEISKLEKELKKLKN